MAAVAHRPEPAGEKGAPGAPQDQGGLAHGLLSHIRHAHRISFFFGHFD